MAATRRSNDEGAATTEDELGAKWQAVLEKATGAARRVGRDPAEVTVVAVSKTHPVDVVAAAIRAGMRDLGENYVQEFVGKREQLASEAEAAGVRWHFIGHLQRNKVKQVAGACALIHSVDSRALALEIDRQAARRGVRQPVLVEVNAGGEETKFGVAREDVVELARELAGFEHLELQGLMTVEPMAADPEACRPVFRAMTGLAREGLEAGLPPETMRHLSMGMTQDYGVAIEEGATLVRVGTAIFGPRHSK